MPSESTGVSVKTEKAPAVSAPAPWTPFEALRNDIDRVFENFVMSPFKLRLGRRMFDLDMPTPRRSNWELTPAVDVTEKSNGYEVTVELPGLTEKDVEVKISNGMLTVRGEKKETKETQEKEYHLSERRYGSFTRSMTLPDGVDADKIDASFSKGVLTVKLPKTAEATQNERRVTVKAS